MLVQFAAHMRSSIVFSLLTAASAFAQTENVYVDGLGSGWQSWSWPVNAEPNYFFTNASPVYAGTASIKLVQSAWAGLSLHHTSIATNAYQFLEFYIHGGTSGGQLLDVHLEDDATGASAAHLNLESYLVGGGGVTSGAWKQVSIPCSALTIAAPTFTP